MSKFKLPEIKIALLNQIESEENNFNSDDEDLGVDEKEPLSDESFNNISMDKTEDTEYSCNKCDFK